MLAFFTTGLLLGGLVAASVLWLLSGLPEPAPAPARAAAVAAAAAVGALREFVPLLALRLPLPQNARQIPQEVLQFKPRLGPLQFGFELGTGVRTYISSTAPIVLAVAVLLSHPSPWSAATAGLGFGLGRAATAAVNLWSRSAGWNDRAAARIGLITKITAVVILGFVLLDLWTTLNS